VEVRGLPTEAYHTKGVENVVECENGFLVSPSYNSAVAYDRDGNIVKKFEGGGDANHFNNFLQVVRSRRMKDLNCSALEAHRSCALLHMANISYRLGSETPFEPKRADFFGSDTDANAAFEKMTKHLVDNGVPLSSAKFSLGRRLSFNTERENFGKDEEANRML